MLEQKIINKASFPNEVMEPPTGCVETRKYTHTEDGELE